MKKVLLTSLLALLTTIVAICQAKVPATDQSPMDMSYYPPNYPILKIQDKITDPLVARVIYSRPRRNGRTVFNELVEYNKVWRIGANEATEIEFFKDVRFAGKPVPKGKYTLYAVPDPQKWVMILNKETDTWGSFKYDVKKDIVRVELPVEKLSEPLEDLAIYFDKTTQGFNMYAGWESASVIVPISIAEKPSSKTPAKTLRKNLN